MDSPIACTLTEAQIRERRREILDPFRAKISRSEILANGYAYVIETFPSILIEVARLVDLERRCCPFLSFNIGVQAGNQSIRLEITGPPEAKSVIADFFGT
jgi:hypothetical protein